MEAIQAFEQVRAIAPKSDVVHFILGMAYLKNGGVEKAFSEQDVLEGLKSDYADQLFREIKLHPNPENFNLSGIELLSKCPK